MTLRIGGETKTLRVCNLVCEAFHGPKPLGKETCHNDGNSRNNAASNLRWDTRKGNFADMIAHGTRRSGERHHNVKITAEGAAEIRRLCAEGVKQKDVGAQFGISQVQISRIVNGKRWRASD